MSDNNQSDAVDSHTAQEPRFTTADDLVRHVAGPEEILGVYSGPMETRLGGGIPIGPIIGFTLLLILFLVSPALFFGVLVLTLVLWSLGILSVIVVGFFKVVIRLLAVLDYLSGDEASSSSSIVVSTTIPDTLVVTTNSVHLVTGIHFNERRIKTKEVKAPAGTSVRLGLTYGETFPPRPDASPGRDYTYHIATKANIANVRLGRSGIRRKPTSVKTDQFRAKLVRWRPDNFDRHHFKHRVHSMNRFMALLSDLLKPA